MAKTHRTAVTRFERNRCVLCGMTAGYHGADMHAFAPVVMKGIGDVFLVEVTGFDGAGRFVRRTLAEAMATARRYAKLFDAPRSVLGEE